LLVILLVISRSVWHTEIIAVYLESCEKHKRTPLASAEFVNVVAHTVTALRYRMNHTISYQPTDTDRTRGDISTPYCAYTCRMGTNSSLPGNCTWEMHFVAHYSLIFHTGTEHSAFALTSLLICVFFSAVIQDTFYNRHWRPIA
jgi:hypothetical protein